MIPTDMMIMIEKTYLFVSHCDELISFLLPIINNTHTVMTKTKTTTIMMNRILITEINTEIASSGSMYACMHQNG